jgi:integrase
MSSDLAISVQKPAKTALPSVLDELEAEAQRIEKLAQAQTTQDAYQAAWAHFEGWCRERGLASLPTNAAIVRGYVTDLQQTNIPKLKPPRKYSVSTIEQRLAAIKKCHLVAGHPLDLSRLGELRKGLRSDKAKKKVRKSQKKALLDNDLVEMLRRMNGSLRDLRDRAILLLGFVGAMRRSEIAGIDVEQIEFVEGGAKIALLQSKGDRKSEGVVVSLVNSARPILCAVQALKDWLAASAIESGPLLREIDRFGYIGAGRLTTFSIRNIVIKRAAAAGYTSNISTHSLRRGAVTAALQSGAPIQKVSKHVRHKSVQMTMRYYDDVQGIEDNAMIAVLGTAHENDPPAPVPMRRGDQVLRGEVIDYDEFAKAPSDPIKVNRIELREVDTSALQESIADVDAMNKRLSEKFGASK